MLKMVNKLCFVAVVRDESPVIERCLESIRNIATSYLICDTGSKDDTASKIEEYMRKANIPGEVIHTEWVSYGETKSYLFEKFKAHPVVGDAEYLGWLDADEVFIMNKDDPCSYPTPEDAERIYKYMDSRSENVFMVTTLYGNLNYHRWQFARNNQLYKWCLPYQEYFKGTEYTHTHSIDFMWNYARHEGNSSRDPEITKKRVKMAEDWLDRNPKDPKDHDYSRMLFYIAEAYSFLDGEDEQGKSYKEKAIDSYKKRLEALGFYQEKYISMLRMSKLVSHAEKIALYWRAIEFIPDRLEAFYELMMIYYTKGDHEKAAVIGALAPKSRDSPQGALFIDRNVYDYKFDMNWSVSCHFSGDNVKALEIGKSVLERGKISDEANKKIAENNVRVFESHVPAPSSIERLNLSMPLPSLYVIDNFYDDPDEIRADALQMDFTIKGNYPGLRTSPLATDNHKELFERIVGRKITHWSDEYNGSFQYTVADQKSWIHRDNTDFSAIVYLSPEAPLDGGTCLWQHKETPEEDGNDESKWELVDKIGNKYNRAIIFQGHISHKSDRYFGNDLESGRLFQTFFFNVQGRKF